MEICPKCSAPTPAGGRFCTACGAALSAATAPDPDLTVGLPEADAPTRTSTAPRLPSSATPGARFNAGDRVTDRYRIRGLLGRGGMGEVYRAEDLKLGQDVALKFLPQGLEQDENRLGRFLNEVRTALRVTHPNVCRVYDIAEFEGQHFLSMEYVDGEDLATSLRRYGRLPEERAVEVARQICAGLAAAHEQGILHRDLKPANVMIDGAGRVKLTDFGLAGLAGSIDGAEVRVGTPAYLSPEQGSGREVTERSDIYALGLVLYELFTGRQPFHAESADEYRRLHNESMPSNPTELLPGLDPSVERAILRCLDKKPERRPGSALLVAAALPGGDPLQAALAAGETPSPELVAAAGNRSALAVGRSLLLAALAILLLAGGAHWAGRMSLLNYLPLDKRPEVLMDRARQIVGTLGFEEEVYSHPADRAWGFLLWNDILQEVGAADSSLTRWDALRQRPDAAGFWYRQSPDLLLPDPSGGPVPQRQSVTLTNPMPSNAGEVSIVLDLEGRLRRFEALPKRFSTGEPSEPDWSELFTLADLDPTRFQETAPRYQRFMAPDLRRAWLGTRAEQPAVPIRVEAGAFEGRPVLFNVATVASLENLGEEPTVRRVSTGDWLQSTIQPVLILLIVVVAIRRSRRNLHAGSSDTRGAVRFGWIVFVLYLTGHGIDSHSLWTREWANEIWPLFAGGIFMSMAAWGMYTAAEPMGRRIWPEMFISSSRLLSGKALRWRDPLIGQSVLVGLVAAGITFLLAGPAQWWVRAHLLGERPTLAGYDLELLRGQREVLAHILDQGVMLGFVFIHIMVLVLARYLLKRRVAAVVATLVLWTLLGAPGSWVSLIQSVLTSAVFLAVLLRWGVVAMAAGRIALGLVWTARPADWTSWYTEGSVMIVVALALLAAYGAWAATGPGADRAEN